MLSIEGFCELEHPRLLASLTLCTGDQDLAAELAQEALARAHRDWSKVALMDSPGGWVHRVAMNLASSHFRRRRYEQAARLRCGARLAAEATAPAPDPPDQVLQRALAALPMRQREAVALRFLLDLSIEETASRMDCAAGTVRALTAQGVAQLRTALADVKEASDG